VLPAVLAVKVLMDEIDAITCELAFPPPPAVETLTSKLAADATYPDDDIADATSYSHDGNDTRFGRFVLIG
jgi:hypothetical protein